MNSDLELLERYVRTQSQEAFSELVRRHVDLVYSAALRRVGMDVHLAEDVTQEVFADFARSSRSLLRLQALEGWLYSASRFKAIDAVRRASRRRCRETRWMPAGAEAPPAALDWARLRPVIDEALDTLPKADLEVVVLRYFKNCSFADVGRALALTEDAARMRSVRALDRLRKALLRRGIASTGDALGLVLVEQAVAASPAGLAAAVAPRAAGAAGAAAAPASLQAAGWAKIALGTATLALLLGSLATAYREYRLHESIAAQLAVAKREQAEAAERLQQLKDRLGGAAAAERRLAAAVAAARLGTGRPRGPNYPDAVAAGRALAASNPNSWAVIAGHDMAHNAQRYVALFSSLALSPEKQVQFLHLLAQRADLGLTWYLAPAGADPSGVIAPADALTADQVEAQLSSLLGPDGYQAYQDFNREGAAQSVAQQVAGSLYASATPLSQAQARQLVQILAQSSPDYQAGRDLGTPSQIGWDAVLASAPTVLSLPQVQALVAVKQAIAVDRAMNAAAAQGTGAALEALDSPPTSSAP